MTTTPYRVWCIERGVTHAHCPDGCEHPQPFVATTGELLCGRCWHKYRQITVMQPCHPETCE